MLTLFANIQKGGDAHGIGIYAFNTGNSIVYNRGNAKTAPCLRRRSKNPTGRANRKTVRLLLFTLYHMFPALSTPAKNPFLKFDKIQRLCYNYIAELQTSPRAQKAVPRKICGNILRLAKPLMRRRRKEVMHADPLRKYPKRRGCFMELMILLLILLVVLRIIEEVKRPPRA
jgi:hypothetical protein